MKFLQNYEILAKFVHFGKVLTLLQNSEILAKFWSFGQILKFQLILKFQQNSEISAWFWKFGEILILWWNSKISWNFGEILKPITYTDCFVTHADWLAETMTHLLLTDKVTPREAIASKKIGINFVF